MHASPLAATIPGLMTWTPWRFFLVAIAGWMNRIQQKVIASVRSPGRPVTCRQRLDALFRSRHWEAA